jgi:hypothetical protein
MVSAGPGPPPPVTVALKTTAAPVTPVAVALTCTAPAVPPAVSVVWARPSASVVSWSGATEPGPEATENTISLPTG